MLNPDRVGWIQNVQYYYCNEPGCEVVYFSNESVPSFKTDDIRVKVFAKDKGEDVNVCYCYGWTRGRIKEQLIKSAKSTASLEIAMELKSGPCVCEIKNPKGECCLGDVNSFVRSITPT